MQRMRKCEKNECDNLFGIFVNIENMRKDSMFI